MGCSWVKCGESDHFWRCQKPGCDSYGVNIDSLSLAWIGQTRPNLLFTTKMVHTPKRGRNSFPAPGDSYRVNINCGSNQQKSKRKSWLIQMVDQQNPISWFKKYHFSSSVDLDFNHSTASYAKKIRKHKPPPPLPPPPPLETCYSTAIGVL